MSNAPEGKPQGRCPAWLKVALVLSLAANVAIVGLFIGSRMQGDKDAYGANRQISWILKLVPEARHEATKEKFEARRDDLRKTQAERNRQLQAIVRAIRADPFSPEELDRAMRLRREAGDERRVIVHSELIEILGSFTPADRQVFADRMEERMVGLVKRQNR